MIPKPDEKRRLGERFREWILATNGLPGWVCVGHEDPPLQLRVCLQIPDGEIDITGNHAIVALKPLTVAAAADQLNVAVLNGTRPWAVIKEPANGRVLGRIRFRWHRSITAGDGNVCLFQTERGRDYCAAPLHRQITYLHERWKMARDKNPRNIHMVPSELFSLWILHDVPRPVLLVSYGNVTRANIFPMDLLGPLTNGWFVLGLHATSPAIDVWRESRRIAVSTVPLRYKSTVYGMGRNHREPFLDAAALPTPCGPSQSYRIPVPDAALSVRELRIEDSLDLGSHVLFVAATQTLDIRAAEPQMCHVHRFYQQFLMRQNRPLPSI